MTDPTSHGRGTCHADLPNGWNHRGIRRLFAEAVRVLQPDAPIVAVDSVESDALRSFDEGDTYQPIDPTTLPARLQWARFTEVEVRVMNTA